MDTRNVRSTHRASALWAAAALLVSGIACAATSTSASSSAAYDELSKRSSPSLPSHSTPPRPATPPPAAPRPLPARPNVPATNATRPQANIPQTPAATQRNLPGANQRGPNQASGTARSTSGAEAPHSTIPTSYAPISFRDPNNHSGVAQSAGGSVVRTRADGSRAEIHDAHNGIDIHYGPNGARRILSERADHSRVFADHGSGYVQHPYSFRGQELAQRTYFEHGHEFTHFYTRNIYHGVPLNVYVPVRFYSVAFYGWVYEPWPASIHYVWEWRTKTWYRTYYNYFVPYPVYENASYWLTDYLIATSLEAAYAAQVRAQIAAGESPTLSPDVKAAIADQVRSELQQEQAAARANVADPQELPDNGGISTVLTDGNSHVFMAGSNLDITDGSGNDCTISAGDVVQVRAAPAPGSQAVNATVLASKGGNECATGTMIRVGLPDLQEMQNYMRATVDQGMTDLQTRQGTGNLPAAPASAQSAAVSAGFAVNAPPPDTNAQTEINEQAALADLAEKEASVAEPQ